MSVSANSVLNLRTVARSLIGASFFFAGLAETLSATGLVVELAPGMFWGMEPHTLPLGGPVQIAGAALLFSRRKTVWALGVLVAYLILGTIFSNLPLILRPEVGDAALAGLVSNMAVVGGMLYWLQAERSARGHASDVHLAEPALPEADATFHLHVVKEIPWPVERDGRRQRS